MVSLLCAALYVNSQEVENILPKWNYVTASNSSLYKSLADQAVAKLQKRKNEVLQLKSSTQWLGRQTEVRKKFRDLLGAFPEKTPLNAVVTGRVENEYADVEKIYFESLPGYYVTGALFLPKNRKGKLPAILYCSGHSKSGFRSRGYQHVILNLVKKGFAVFAFDPIGQGERRQFIFNEKRKLFSTTQDHSYPGNQVFLTGRSPAYYFIWDGVRALDYLVSRPEIDARRIGLTGRSGGGKQTAYIAAFDDRIQAAAPECYVTSFEKLLLSIGPQDAEQNIAGSIDKGLDIADLLICFAPKPLLMISTTRDIFSIQGARDVYQELKSLYSATGNGEKVAMAEDDAAHESTRNNREAMYHFFQRHLANPGNSADESTVAFNEEALRVSPEGNVYRGLMGHNLQTLSAKYLSELLAKRKKISGLAELKKKMEETVYRQPVVSSTISLFSGRWNRKSYNVEAYLLKAEDRYLPAYWLKPNSKPPAKDLVLLLDDRGKMKATEEGGLADSLAIMGYQVVVPDLSGFGELANGYIRGGDAYVDNIPLNLWYTSVLMNESLLSVRIKEIMQLLNWLKPGTNHLSGIARGILTTDLLHTAILKENGFRALVCIDPLMSYQSVIREPEYKTAYILSAVPGMVARYDIPDLIQYLPIGQSLFLTNPRNGAGQPLDPAQNSPGDPAGLIRRKQVEMEYQDTSASRVGRWLEGIATKR